MPISEANRRYVFLLPERNRSGGTRVTVQMVNQLLDRHIDASIVILPADSVKARIRRLRHRFVPNSDWISEYKGTLVERFQQQYLSRLTDRDCVIGVGSYVIPFLKSMQTAALKIRYCHGLHLYDELRMTEAWRGRMPTLAVSKINADILSSKFGCEGVIVVPNGIDTERYFPEKNILKSGVGTIFSQHPAKSPEVIIDFFAELARVSPDTPRIAFSTVPKPANLDVTRYVRSPPVATARMLYSSCAIWTILSRAEGLPGQALEALACGTPVVASNEPGCASVIRDGVEGLLFPVGDAAAAVGATVGLLSDSKRLEKLGAAALSRSLDFTWQSAADSFVNAVDRFFDASVSQEHGRG